MAEDENKSKRKFWSKEETLGLLKCYSARKDEFVHSRKRKNAYQNVLEDMIYQGYTTSRDTTALSLDKKMRNLLAAYKAAKDNSKKTGAGLCIAPYMQDMEEIFGDKPIVSNNHTLHLGTVQRPQPSTSPLSPSIEFVSVPNSSPISSLLLTPQEQLSNESFFSEASELDLPIQKNSHKRKSARDRFYERRLQMKQEAVIEKNRRQESKEAQRAQFMQNMMSCFQEKWKKDYELKEKKLALLEKISNK